MKDRIMLNLNDIFTELSEKELCLKVNPHIAGDGHLLLIA
jgi:hypothetical protein